ncbi:hypothetical protein VPAL9027_00484 [Vibrio palustris]|uniref:Uncharacterized protein n=1 Tax=Vibrio palustris TaxID=1918946 RepID=A0A1R4B0V8_9VIBR|nr:hypothetical protein VPAL9027_00484 [Vibrio palustris]
MIIDNVILLGGTYDVGERGERMRFFLGVDIYRESVI